MKLGPSFWRFPLALPNRFNLYLSCLRVQNGQFNAQINFNIQGCGRKNNNNKKRICWGYSCAFGFDLLPTSLFNNQVP